MSATIVARGPSSVRMRFRPGLVGAKGDQAQSTTDAQAAAALAEYWAQQAEATLNIPATVLAVVQTIFSSLPASTDGMEPAGLAVGALYWNGDFLCRKSST